MAYRIIPSISNGKKVLKMGIIKDDTYLIVRNNSFDDTVYVEQNISEDDTVTTGILRGCESSFLVKDSDLDISIGTKINYSNENKGINKKYKGISLIVNSQKAETGNLNIVVIDVVNAVEWSIDHNLDAKSGIFHKGTYDDAVSDIEEIINRLFPDSWKYTERRILSASYYTTKFVAGRGFLISDITSEQIDWISKSPSLNLSKQVYSKDWKVGMEDENKIDGNMSLYVNEIPYVNEIIDSDLKKYGSQSRLNPKSVTFDNVIGRAMFYINGSIKQNGLIRPINFVKHSGINTIGGMLKGLEKLFPNITESGVIEKPAKYDKELYDLQNTPLYYYGSESVSEWVQDRYQSDNVKAFAVDIKVISENFPYTIAFSAPILLGITFLGPNSVIVHCRDRAGNYNNINVPFVGKLCRFLVNYETEFIQLYINGVKQQIDSQNSLVTKNRETNIFGLDVKESYKHKLTPFILKFLTIPTTNGVIGDIEAEVWENENDTSFIDSNKITINPVGDDSDTNKAINVPEVLINSGEDNSSVYLPIGSKLGNATMVKDDTEDSYKCEINKSNLSYIAHPKINEDISLNNKIVEDISEIETGELIVDSVEIKNIQSGSSKSIENGIAFQIGDFSSRFSAQNERISDEEGYTVSSDVKNPVINILSSRSSTPVDKIKTKIGASFFSTNGTNYKSVEDLVYSIVETTPDTTLLSDDTTFGTDTCKCIIGIISDSDTVSSKQMLQSILADSKINYVWCDTTSDGTKYRPSGKAGYRGVNGTKYPRKINIDEENGVTSPSGVTKYSVFERLFERGTDTDTENGSSVNKSETVSKNWDKIIGYMEICLNQSMDQAIDNVLTVEGRISEKYYKCDILINQGLQIEEKEFNHENTVMPIHNTAFALFVMQIASTEGDKNDYIGVKFLKDESSFSIDNSSKEVALESIIYNEISEGFKTINKGVKNISDGLVPLEDIYLYECHIPLSHVYNLYLNESRESLPDGVDMTTKFLISIEDTDDVVVTDIQEKTRETSNKPEITDDTKYFTIDMVIEAYKSLVPEYDKRTLKDIVKNLIELSENRLFLFSINQINIAVTKAENKNSGDSGYFNFSRNFYNSMLYFSKTE